MKNLFILFVISALLPSCKKDLNQINNNSINASSVANAASDITTTKAIYWDSVFTRYGGGWTGGDAAVSYPLPDGRVMWLWGDSFLDTVYPDRHRPIIGFIHNQIVTTNLEGGEFTTYYGGIKRLPKPFFESKDGNTYYWPGYAFMNKNNTQVFVSLDKVKPTGEGGAFGFEVVGVDFGILSFPQLTLQKIVPFSRDKTINWAGNAWEDNNNGYVYLYGTESTTWNKYVHVARTTKNNPMGDITYYDGNGWVKDPSKSTRVLGGVSESYTFFKYQNKYYLLSQGSLLSRDIYIWDAASPVGPFTQKRLVYTTPSKVGSYDVWTYNATAHLEFTTANNQLLVGYCTNAISSFGIWNNADTYRPYFVWASNWQ